MANAPADVLEDVIDLNVGGELMSVRRQTLCAIDGTMLATMFSGRWGHHARDSTGRIFLDFNPVCFRKIVDFLWTVSIGSPTPPVVLPAERPVFCAITRYLLLDGVLFPQPARARFQVKAGDQCVISDDGLTATLKATRKVPDSNLLVEPRKAVRVVAAGDGVQSGVHCWPVTIVRCPEVIWLGITSHDGPNTHAMNTHGVVRSWGSAEGTIVRSHALGPYGFACSAEGTVVEVILDCTARTLSFAINGFNLGIALADIDISVSWTLFCSLYGQQSSVRLRL